ncbi:MAG: hypothetical protein OXC44_04125 [Proteobacteria bacterium]|nr:hypothetical protein [Pseudomonadota bacterium]
MDPKISASALRKSRSLKSTLIDPFAQVKLGLYVIIITIVFMGLAFWLFHQAQSKQYQHVQEIFSVTAPDDQRALTNNDIYNENLTNISILFSFYIIILFSVIFRLTHKYYGPLISIKRFTECIIEGKYYSRVSVRKRDELNELATRLNTMATTLEDKHGSLVDKDGRTIRRRKADKSTSSENTTNNTAASSEPS